MNIEDIAFVMGKTKDEIEKMLKENDVIELNLTERANNKTKENGDIKIIG